MDCPLDGEDYGQARVYSYVNLDTRSGTMSSAKDLFKRTQFPRKGEGI